MSKAKANAQTLEFPPVEPARPRPPAWLEDVRGGTVARTLFQSSDGPSRPLSLTPSDPHSVAPHAGSEGPAHGADAAAGSAPAKPPAPQPGPAQRQPPPAAQPRATVPDPAAAQAPHQGKPAASGEPPSAAARAADGSTSAGAQATQQAAESERADSQLDEHVWSKLPPPPQLGSLIPGGRSAPPPANDTSLELLHEQREAFTNAAIELAIARAATLSVLEGQLLDLAIDIASSLIEREVEREPELHGTLARAALSSLGDSERVTLRTSADGYAAICEDLGGPEATVRGVHIQVVADDTIPGLGCVVDGEHVRIDATVAERLRAVRRAFEEERRKVAESSE